MSYILGILGGLGPMSSAYFYTLLCERTKASCDQEHIDIILTSRATTPDRTAYILNESGDSPLPAMLEEAKRLYRAGADSIVIPCNTAHYFIDEVRKSVPVPVPSIICETVSHVKQRKAAKVGVFATRGTVLSGAYQEECKRQGVECVLPDENVQNMLTQLIYERVKNGDISGGDMLVCAAEKMKACGCECVILGCTELSVIYKADIGISSLFADSLEILAYRAIKMSGHIPRGFGEQFDYE